MQNKESVVDSLYPVLNAYLNREEIAQLIEVPAHASHGDLAFPVFSLAKIMKKAPQLIAKELLEGMDTRSFEKVEVVGPYLNFFLNRVDTANRIVHQILSEADNFGDSQVGKDKRIVIDMSSPNIAKPMSMGHLRSTVIGNAIALIYKKLGYDITKVNHLGDWGTQFGKLIVAYQLWGDEAVVRANPVTELVKLYVDFHERVETQPELEEQARAVFKQLEEGDPQILELWQWFKEESLKEFEKVYQLLGVTFDSYNGEAFYNDKMTEVIDLLEAQHISEVENGATLVKLEEENLPPALIKKSDGATLYMTRDLATAYYRKRTYQFDKSLYVMGNEQSNHFKQLTAVLKKMGNDWADDMFHVAFGLITINGRKMSTRKGEIVLLEDVLRSAIDLSLQQIEMKNPNLPHKEAVAYQVGVGAVIFHDLKTERMNGFDFNLEEIVQFEGDTGPYVQYAHARAHSILNKYNQPIDMNQVLGLSDDYAWEVVKKLALYPQIVQQAAERFEPSVIAKYCLQVAQLFNKYYGNSRILEKDEQLNARISLVKAVSLVLKNGLGLLGIEAPEQM